MFLSRSHHNNATGPSSRPGTGPTTGLGRRKSLALPFVMTAAAACTPRHAEEPSKQPAQGPETGHEEATPVIISNPPRPEPADADAEAKNNDETRTAPPAGTVAPTEQPAPVIMRNPPPPRALPAAPATGGHVVVRDDGTCFWHEAVKCPPNTMCNPPPPTQVQCPEVKK